MEEVKVVEAQEQSQTRKSFAQIVSDLSKKENVCSVKGAKIVAMRYNKREEDGYEYFTFTIDKAIEGYRSNNGEFELMLVNSFSVSLFSVLTALRNNEATSNFVEKINKMPSNASFLFIGGEIDIIYQKLNEGDEYVSPFSAVQEPIEIEHDSIYYHVTKLNYGEDGRKIVGVAIDKIAEAFASI